VIDNFLEPPLAEGLLACFEKDGNFEEHHCLKQQVAATTSKTRKTGLTIEQTVSAEDFAAAPDDSRLARELLMRCDPSHNMGSAGWLAHIRFLELLASAEFKSYLAAITDTTDLRDVTYMARTMRHGDLCSAHSDAGDGRKLCMLLYVGDGWRSGFGGRFQNVHDGKVARSVEPLGNRLILHRPAPKQIHQVEPISESGRHWRRHTYSVWFGRFPEHD
jgi:hypothetical protein